MSKKKKEQISDIDSVLESFGSSKWVPLGDTGKEIEIISLTAGAGVEMRKFEADNSSSDAYLAMAFYISLSCPAFKRDIDAVLKLPGQVLSDLFDEVLAFNGIEQDADEEAEKNSQSEPS